MSERRSLRHAVVALLAVLEGCAVGPDFVRPEPPENQQYTAADPVIVESEAGRPAQRLRIGLEVQPRWWQAFGSTALDGMVNTALTGSATLEAARATLAQAERALIAARGPYYPQVTFAASAVRGKAIAARSGSGGLNQFSIGPALSYTPDLFGAAARRIEQAAALADLQRAQYDAAHLALTGNMVLQAIALASASGQIDAVNDIIGLDQRNLDLVQLSAAVGKAAQLDVLTAQSQLASDRALLPPLQQQASVAGHALAVLAGRTAADWAPPALDLNALALPPELPLSLPSRLVRRRPDIVGAEAQLRAANAAIGIASAQIYPNLTLNAAWSSVAGSPGGLFASGTNVWSLAADLLAPVFSGYALQAQRTAAVDAYAAQLANYRQTVLQAFGQVADVLEALQHDADLLDAQRKALDAAQTVVDLTQQGFQAGQSSLLQLLDAQRQYQQARLGYTRAKAQRFADSAQLFIAIGGATRANAGDKGAP
jgi:NodT family efflux transporter outer membrane factor (OMF) lipoprotein